MTNNNQKAFTLYELMITLLIVGAVLAYGIPNMGEFRKNSRMTTAANELHSSFHQARTEAARAKTNITICASTDSMTANPSCGGEFENGWIVFADLNGDIVVNGEDAVLRKFPAMPIGISVNSQGATDYFSFAPSGQGRGDVAGPTVSTLMLCDSRGNVTAAGGHSAARVLVVTPLGRAMVLRDENQVAFHGGC